LALIYEGRIDGSLVAVHHRIHVIVRRVRFVNIFQLRCGRDPERRRVVALLPVVLSRNLVTTDLMIIVHKHGIVDNFLRQRVLVINRGVRQVTLLSFVF